MGIVAGPWQRYEDAEARLATAFASGDEAAKLFWQSVFRALSAYLKWHAETDDASWHVYREARRYADGAVPVVGQEGDAERKKADDAEN